MAGWEELVWEGFMEHSGRGVDSSDRIGAGTFYLKLTIKTLYITMLN